MANVTGIPVYKEIGASPAPQGARDTARVVIVGAGPVGLAMALDLGRRGHAVTVLNRLDFVAHCSKAICFSKRSLDILDRLGVGDPAVDKGVTWNVGKVFWGAGDEPDIGANPLLNWIRKRFPITSDYHGTRFTIRENGTRWFTPLFVVVIMIGITDVIFAVDSIPAIFAITDDPFIVLTSNVFAVLGLRALFFLLAGMADKFHLLAYGLATVLIFIGAKMLIADIWHIPIGAALGVVALAIATSMVASVLIAPKGETKD